jgi:hypothetical protein
MAWHGEWFLRNCSTIYSSYAKSFLYMHRREREQS